MISVFLSSISPFLISVLACSAFKNEVASSSILFAIKIVLCALPVLGQVVPLLGVLVGHLTPRKAHVGGIAISALLSLCTHCCQPSLFSLGFRQSHWHLDVHHIRSANAAGSLLSLFFSPLFSSGSFIGDPQVPSSIRSSWCPKLPLWVSIPILLNMYVIFTGSFGCISIFCSD
jgi:hypothetical protein